MKKWMTVLCAVSMVALLTGCGGSDEKVIEKNPSQSVQEENNNTTAEGNNDAQESKEEQQQDAKVKGYVFMHNDVQVVIDADAAPIIDALGEPVSYFEAASCAFEGLDKMYTYNSFEVDTYPNGDKDYVSTIILMDDSITTAEGIAIGETRARVEEVYGTDYEEQGSMLVYRKDGMKLFFIFEGDTITSIQYGTTALDV
ncbi:MAG: hypothetical protein IJ379_08390 [Lachnospiraceae bacterium]|nr:hypothetical protein [Lachnospiraceae bacterium]